MANNISEMINNHRYPGLFYKFPSLLRVHHYLTNLTTLRNWYLKPAVSKLLKSFPGSFIMYDAGCGAGDLIFPYAAKYKSSLFTGVDKIADNVTMCNAFSENQNIKNCTFEKANIETYISKEPAGIITCITVLQYIDSDETVLNNFNKSLKPGGYLVLYVPVNYKRFFPWFNKITAGSLTETDYDFQLGIKRRYTVKDITSKIISSGFHIIQTINTYKTCGKISFELYSSGLMAIKKLPIPLAIIFIIVFIPLIFPFIFLFMLLDLLEKDKEGNGILIIGRKHFSSNL